VCPTDAYIIRDDGIVYIDESRCMGCGYCSWACPYAAPQYHPELRHMTKCNFCYDNIDAGLPPACVAACPMRVLDFVSIPDASLPYSGEKFGVRALWEMPASDHPYPLPEFSRTQPHVAIKPHAGMSNGLEKTLSNWEEVKPRHTRSELPLVFFTLLAQMAVGAFWAAQWMFTPLWNLVQFDATLLRLIPYLLVGVSLGLGGIFSFAHLGTKKNAWRALTHLSKSWLSREVLFVGLFGAGWALSTLLILAGLWVPAVQWLAGILGAGLVYAMAQVYRIKAIPAWNSWRTDVGFFVTAGLAGTLLMSVVLFYEADFTSINLPPALWATVGGLVATLLLAQMALSERFQPHKMANRLRLGLIGLGLVGAGMIVLIPGVVAAWMIVCIFILVLVEEFIGRWLFYAALDERVM